jgi:hypothetical protein
MKGMEAEQEEVPMVYGPPVEDLTDWEINKLLTVTLWRTGEELPLLAFLGLPVHSVIAIKNGCEVTIAWSECERSE